MGSTQGPKVSLFNNSLLSDITIRQSRDGVTKEYFAHKAVLCVGSGWFVNALTGSFQEASSSTIDLHDDDPVYFELFLRDIYEAKWDQSVADRKTYKPTGSVSVSMTDGVKRALTAIGVYALADKYDVDGLRTLATEQIPDPTTLNIFARIAYPEATIKLIVETHYEQCIVGGEAGRKICLSIITGRRQFAQGTEIEALAKKYPALAIDMYHAGRENDVRLW